MSRTVPIYVFVVAISALACAAAPSPALGQRLERRVMLRAAPPQFEADFRRYLSSSGVAGREQEVEIAAFRRLPVDLQDLLVSRVTLRKPELLGPYMKIDPNKIKVLFTPSISSFWPLSAGPNDWVLMKGTSFNAGSEVYFKAAKQTAYYLGGWLMFQLPSTATPPGSNGEVVVKNGALSSAPASLPLVAARGYRGLWGWKFANAGHPQIPWTVYRNYFGPSAVEFPDGTHRPSAQTWYDSSYKGIGGGGNCYGMSLSSLRIKHGDLNGLLFASWFVANPQPYVWAYDSNRNNDQVWQTIQEMQGSQLAEPQHTILWTRIGSQNANGSWSSATTITGEAAPHGCVMAMTGSGGHATVPYTTQDGTTRKIIHYDNNVPFQSFESSGPDPSVANINATANSFTYGGFNKVAIFDLPELLVSPSLPAGVGSSLGAADTSAQLIVDKPGRVTQITDEKGNVFYVNGQENTGPNRIPGAVYTPPIMGGPVPDSYPQTWLFANSTGKSFTVEVSGLRSESRVLFLQKGRQHEIHAAANGLKFTMSALHNPGSRLIIDNPGAARVESIKIIDMPAADEERTYEIRGIGQVLDRPLEIGLSADRSALEMVNQSARAVPLQVTLRTDRANSHLATRPLAVNLGATQRGILRTPNWRNLAGQALQLEMQGLNGARTGIIQIRP